MDEKREDIGEGGAPIGRPEPATDFGSQTTLFGDNPGALTVQPASWTHYSDLQLLGEGGMGRIYRAFDLVLKREVALKFLARDDPRRMRRFIQEAQNQAKVDHPNVCKVYEVGELNGQAFIAMQLIKGRTLAAARKDLSLEDLASVMETVAAAIHAAHRQGLVHRDLKPANIMVEEDERGLKPYILDFGLARSLESTGLTQQGLVIGTAGFMAPEQAAGLEDQVGIPTDIYAMGATLYALLTGQAPFAGRTGLSWLKATLEEAPVPLREAVPSLPRDLATIIEKCMEKEPRRRYASALALAEDLRRFKEGEPILAHPPTLAYQLGKLARKHKALVAVTAAALAAVLALVAVNVQARRTASAQAWWAQRFGQEAERYEALMRYAHLLPAHDIQQEMAQVRWRMAQLEPNVEGPSNVMAGPACYALARGHLAMGDLPRASAYMERALARGFRSPEAFYMHGRILGYQYLAELDQIRKVADPAVREARLRAADQGLRSAAIRNLEQGRSAALESPDYTLALLAFYGRRLDEALARARASFSQTPWFYEAKGLEGDILLDQAGAARPEAFRGLLEAAVACFQSAQTMAPSDPDLCLSEARAWRLAMEKHWQHGEDAAVPFARGLAALDRAKVLDPSRLGAQALEAWFHFARARALNNQGQDPSEELDRALSASAEVLSRDPAYPGVQETRMAAFGETALVRWRTGGDPVGPWEQAIEAGEKAVASAPNDPLLLPALSRIHLRLMVYRAQRGLDATASWEAARTLMERAVKAYPDLAAFHVGLGAAHEEWAEQELAHGRDPSRSAETAITALEQAIRLDPNLVDGHYYLGVAAKLLGEYQLAAGQDPRKALAQARVSLERALTVKGDLVAAIVDLAACRLDLAKAELAQGRSPMDELAAARLGLAEAARRNPRAPFPRFLRALCDLVEIRWQLVRQPAARVLPLFQRAEADITRYLRISSDKATWAALAELYATWASAAPRAGVLESGLRAARKAVELDPSFGEGYLRLGDLEALAAAAEIPEERRAAALARARQAYVRGTGLGPLVAAAARTRLERLR